MVRKGGRMLKYFLIFNLFLSSINIIYGQDSSSVVIVDKQDENYPGAPLLMSLIIPGSGQYYNKSPLWKTITFLGVEISSMAAWYHYTSKADKLRDEYEAYADRYWSLADWVYNRENGSNHVYKNMVWSDFESLNKLTGTHDLTIYLIGSLASQYGTYVSSDYLESNPINRSEPDPIIINFNPDSMFVVRDRHFYENIGKYDQFTGGWSDAGTDWFWEEKNVGDETETVIKTPRKEDYLDQRLESNTMLNYAKFTISAILFNHVLSGLEAVWTNQRNAKKKMDSRDLDANLSLIYNPINESNIGGLSLTINF